MKLSGRLNSHASAIVLVSVVPFLLMANSATAQQAADGADSVETVVVTGTSIRGAGPVGSTVQTVTAADMQAIGVTDATQILADAPSINFFGSAGRASANASNGTVGTVIGIHDLGGMASGSSLVLIDGHRGVQTGQLNYFVNPDQIPANMIERVEILADGASAVYGSDAVSGVVNFITRDKFEGLELGAKGTFADGMTAGYQTSLLMGSSWTGGNFVLGAAYTHDGELTNAARPFTNPLGQPARAAAHGITGTNPTNFGNFNCAPATLQPGSTGNIFLNATSGVYVANTPANNPCQQWQEGAIFPNETRMNAMVKVSQQLSDRLTLSGDLLVYHRANQQPVSAGTLTATAFGTGAQANPFYQTPVGYTGAATTESVRWDANSLLPPGFSRGSDDTQMADGALDYNIDDNWDVNLHTTVGRSDLVVDSSGTLNAAAALLALNGTAQTSGSTTTTDIPGYNTITLNLPLTAANALDVWNPAGTNRTSATVRSQLANSATTSDGYYSLFNTKLAINGTLFDLWAGPVKVAAGVEVYDYSEKVKGTNPGGAAPAGVDSLFYNYTTGRGDVAEYLEADLPLVSTQMGVPLVQSLELDIAGRRDDYSDFGVTYNPKLGLNWQVIDSIRLKANWGTSFVAPPLTISGNKNGLWGYSVVGGGTGGAIGAIPVSLYPEVTQFGIPGCTSTSVTCNISTLQGVTNLLGQRNLNPETGHTWSVGVGFTPDFLPGFTSNITYWNIGYGDVVARPGQTAAVNTPSLVNYLKLFPNCATAAQILPFTLSDITGPGTGVPVPQTSPFPACVQFGNYPVTTNSLWLWDDGVDFSASYTFETDAFGRFTIGTNGTILVRFDNGYGTSEPSPSTLFSTLNMDGANGGFDPVAQTMRSHLSWQLSGMAADLFMNYTGAFRNAGTSAATSLGLGPTGLINGTGGDHVNANVTFDLHLGYNFDGGILGGDAISLSVNNIFNKLPPYFNASAGYDTSVANPIGRLTTIGFDAKF